MSTKRVISPAVMEGDGDLELDVHSHMISQPLALIGIRWIGKSYEAGVMCEQLCEAKQPFIVIDPEGEYWTLKERYPVIVAAVGRPIGRPKGYKADLILTSETAPALARRIAEKGYTVVLDLRNATMAESYATLGSFLEALYEAEAQYNRPIVVFMEEAHVLIPEVGRVRLPGLKKLQDKVIYWSWEIAARGRHRGLGYVCIARRAAEVAKAVLSQCPTRFIFKLVDPVDLAWLRESGFSKKEIADIQRLPKGTAYVRGLNAEPVKVHSKERLCTHGGSTPIARAVETPELENAIADLSKLIKAPPVPAPPRIEVMAEFEAKRKQVERLKGLVSGFKKEVAKLRKERDTLRGEFDTLAKDHELSEKRVTELEAETEALEAKANITDEERGRYHSQIEQLKEQLAGAEKLEAELGNLRELFGDWKDLLIETFDRLGMEVIPKDIQEIIRERDQYRAVVETYKREEELRKELFKATLQDPSIRSWIRDAERFLHGLKREGLAGGVLLKAVLRMDPDITFFPEDVESGYTSNTNRKYFRRYASKGLLWQVQSRGRTAFRSRFHHWVTENVRKIKPGAPDGAIDEIADHLKKSVIGG